MFREPRSSLPKVFISKDIEVKESPIHGWGCFAIQDIEPGILIESAPVIICHRNIQESLYSINDHRHILQDYPFGWTPGFLAFAMGYAAIYNHQADSNCNWRPNHELETIEIITRRKILADEEITIRYLPVRLKGALWFADEDNDSRIEDVVDAASFMNRDYVDWKIL